MNTIFTIQCFSFCDTWSEALYLSCPLCAQGHIRHSSSPPGHVLCQFLCFLPADVGLFQFVHVGPSRSFCVCQTLQWILNVSAGLWLELQFCTFSIIVGCALAVILAGHPLLWRAATWLNSSICGNSISPWIAEYSGLLDGFGTFSSFMYLCNSSLKLPWGQRSHEQMFAEKSRLSVVGRLCVFFSFLSFIK